LSRVLPALLFVSAFGCNPEDPCEAASLYEPTVWVGLGAREYADIDPASELPSERGMQGGSHVEVAAQMTGIHPGRRLSNQPEAQPPTFIATLTSPDGIELGYGSLTGQVPQGDASLSEMTGIRLFLDGANFFDSTTDVTEPRLATLLLEVQDACGVQASDEREVYVAW